MRLYDKLSEYVKRLKCYTRQVEICGEKRNSYSKTDKQECGALIKSMVLQYKLSYLEMQAIYLRGCYDCVGYLKKAGIL